MSPKILYALVLVFKASGVYDTVRARVCMCACRVVFNEVVQTSKYYMRDVTAVESAWLVELAPHFYKQAKVGICAWSGRSGEEED